MSEFLRCYCGEEVACYHQECRSCVDSHSALSDAIPPDESSTLVPDTDD